MSCSAERRAPDVDGLVMTETGGVHYLHAGYAGVGALNLSAWPRPAWPGQDQAPPDPTSAVTP